MTRTLRRATCALAALFVAAFLSGCYTAAPSHRASTSGAASHGYASYQTPSGSFGVAVFTSAPQHHGTGGSIWYYGNHPHPANHVLGPLCHVHGSHRHDYAPYRGHRYAFHDGHYFWVGDARPYALRDHSNAYYGHHPHPHYFGGTCRIRGLHQHGYAPRTANYYRLKGGAYFYTGTYGPDYYAERNQYDTRGWRLDHHSHGYLEHERAWQKHRSADAAHENPPSHLHTGSQLSREEFAEPDAVDQRSPARPHSRRKASRAAVVYPYDALDAAERTDVRRGTAQGLLERMRKRTRGASGSAPANAADDGAHE